MRAHRLLPPLILIFGGSPLLAAPVFQDGFEAETLRSEWSLSGTNNGRARLSTEDAPATGVRHLVLDDSVSDAIYSSAEATAVLDLTAKKSVVLSFKAKSLGNEPHTPPAGNFVGMRNYDGVAISADGGTTWRSVYSLATLSTGWQSYSVTLDGSVTSLGATFGPGFRIRFSSYDNSPTPIDGIAIDDVSITAEDDQRLVVELPIGATEGSGPQTGYVMVAIPPTSPMTVSLSAAPANQVTLPATVTIPAGATFQSFTFSPKEDDIVNGTRSVTFTATAPGATSGTAAVAIVDNDIVNPTLSLPAQLTEGVVTTGNATLSIDRTAGVALTFSLSAVPANELTLPSSITIPVGQNSVSFTARATDDIRIDGNLPVTVTATLGSAGTVATTTTQTVDNEQRLLSLTLPDILLEGATGNASVSLSGTLTGPTTITLSSPQSSAVGLPATVTIPAGSTQAGFQITATDNSLRDGSRQVVVEAQSASFTGASKSLTIRDNEAASYRFAALSDIVNVGEPLSITLNAADVEGNPIGTPANGVNLSIVLPDGSTQPLQPGTIQIPEGGYTGNVALPAVSATPLRLRASDAGGITGESTAFDILRVIPLAVGDLAWDAGRGRLYASVPSASGTYANKVVAINPQTLEITGSVTTNHLPGQLALTSGGEYLYASLDSNGTVAKINPATLTVDSTFALGNATYYGTLYAEDISTVAGQPDLLVVSQYRKSVSPRHNGVAVYDKGVVRPTKTADHTGSNIIEASADPTIFYGQNTETTEYGFRKMKLDANGITVLEVKEDLITGFNSNIRSDGDRIFSGSGIVVNGPQMKRAGSFNTMGAVRPDLASNRVYFIESSDPNSYYGTSNKLSAYDPNTFARIGSFSLPSPFANTEVASFIRWGSNGLAFRSNSAVVLISCSRLVPSEAPADLAVTVQATPNPATVGTPVTYTVKVTNQGPNLSPGTVLTTTLSDSQTLVSAVSTVGTPVVSGLQITTQVGDLAVGASATLTVVTTPQSAGSLTCTSSANSRAVDLHSANNVGFQLTSVGFQSGPDAVNQLRLAANNLIYDAGRGLFWATIPATEAGVLSRAIVSINPQTGLISQPIPIGAAPMKNSMALSANGRYLYVGLSDVPEVHRLDLSTNPATTARIDTTSSQWGSLNYAQDIEVLDGDGTSFLIAGTDDHSAAVYDGLARRGDRSGIYTVDRIERSATPGTFIGYDNYSSGFEISRLAVGPSGVTVSQSVSNVIGGYYVDIRGEDNLLLSSNGRLIDSTTVILKSNLGGTGRPVVDKRYERAYLVADSAIRGYEAESGSLFGSKALPTSKTGDWAVNAIRWGVDGFAVLDTDRIFITRWSASIPAGADHNADGIPDAWAARYSALSPMKAAGDDDRDQISNALEYLFGTDPSVGGTNPLSYHISPPALTRGISSGGPSMHFVFPRRQGVSREDYDYQVSSDLITWNVVNNVSESVTPTQPATTPATETVAATIPVPESGKGFVRLKWRR